MNRSGDRGRFLTGISLGAFILLLLLVVFGLWDDLTALGMWLILVLLMLGLLAGLGLNTNGKVYGVIIERDRNRASLSRLQVTAWTVLIVSAFMTVALIRSRPGALKQPTAAQVAVCQTEYLANAYGLDLDTVLANLKNEGDDTTGTAAAESTLTQDDIDLQQIISEAEDVCLPHPLNITMPTEALLVLGISTASFAGSSLVKQNKKGALKRKKDLSQAAREDRSAAAAELRSAEAAKQTYTRLSAQVTELETELKSHTPGTGDFALIQVQLMAKQAELNRLNQSELDLAVNKAQLKLEEAEATVQSLEKGIGILATSSEPALNDIFKEDTAGQHNAVDLSKIQMFFFTAMLIVAYAAAIGAAFEQAGAILAPLGFEFPDFSATMTTLLGISHAGYLTVKNSE